MKKPDTARMLRFTAVQLRMIVMMVFALIMQKKPSTTVQTLLLGKQNRHDNVNYITFPAQNSYFLNI